MSDRLLVLIPVDSLLKDMSGFGTLTLYEGLLEDSGFLTLLDYSNDNEYPSELEDLRNDLEIHEGKYIALYDKAGWVILNSDQVIFKE